MRCAKLILAVLLATLLLPAIAAAQTASSALVAGTVYDKTGAVVPKATIELLNEATSLRYNQESNEGGQYLFSTVAPGTYKVTVTAQGFRTWVQPSLKVDVAKSYTVNVTLEVGTVAETVEVQATIGAELQKTDATVGTSIGGDALKYLPTPNRSVSGLLVLQPLVAPITKGVTTDTGGQVAGARSDQTSFLIDGGDASSDTEGSGGYNTQFEGEIRPVVPVPAESVEEFRVGTTNPNATFGRSQGGQVTMITKRGTNTLHGSAYWYHQNDNLNANSWDLNAVGAPKPELKDNRFGFTLGGPVWKDKTWLFGHYEGRRFPRTAIIDRVVPTSTLQQGILRFRDAGGNILSFNLATASTCGAAGNQPCDPRGIGISPVITSYLALYPAGNNPARGDGLNTIGFRGVIDNTLRDDFAVARVDHKITDTWNFFGSYRYNRVRVPGTQQVDIVGISGCPQAPCPTRQNPLEPRYVVGGVDGQITSRLTSSTRISWYRHWWEWATKEPFPQVSGTAAALQAAGEGTGATGTTGSGKLFADPINIDTQNGRSRVWNGKDTFVSQNFTWLKGKHNIQFGGSFRNQNIFHQRTDKVTGGLSLGPIFWLRARATGFGSFVDVSSSRPPVVTATANERRWDNLYAAVLGIVDQSAQILTRDGDLNPLSLGLPLQAQVNIKAVEGYVQDIWRVTPSFTATIGLTYQVQRPPTEELGRQMVPVFTSDQAAFDLWDYFNRRAVNASQGQNFDPDIAYSPIRHVPNQKYVTPIDWNNVGPRLAFAWHPGDSWWGIGGGKTVLRGGWSVTYTRMNGVGLVMTPLLGVGLGQVLACTGPRTNGTCAGRGTAGDPTTQTNAFRVGVDGSGSNILPSTLPVAPAQIPFPVARPFGETRSFMIDPGMDLGYAHSLDLTLQHELPWNLIVEVGYVGRLGRNLTQNADFNAGVYFHKDSASGQTLAQAFDAVANALRAGSPVTPQPWFENQVGAGSTATLAVDFRDEFRNSDLASVILLGVGAPFVNDQVLINNFTTDHGTSDYHAGFVSLRRRFSNGLTFDANYTLSHSLDLFGLNQENTQFSFSSPFNRDLDRQPSIFDRRHVFNFHWYYELPFGRGRRFGTDSGVLDKIVGGWHFAGIWTMSSGLPLCVFTGGNYGALTAGACSTPLSKLDPGNVRHLGVTGSSCGTVGDMNLFADPDAVCANFRPILLSNEERVGGGQLRGLGRWSMDFSLGKKTSITERVSLVFSADFLNVFNHPIFNDPSTDLNNLAQFGVLDAQNNAPRFIQLGFRVEF